MTDDDPGAYALLNIAEIVYLVDRIGRDKVCDIAQSFETDTKMYLTAVQSALASGQWSTAAAEAHRLKSASGSLSLDRLRVAASNLEKAAIRQDSETAQSLADNCSVLLDSSVHALWSALET